MRDIKFRGKKIGTNKWVCGYYFYDNIKDKHFILTQSLTGAILENKVMFETVERTESKPKSKITDKTVLYTFSLDKKTFETIWHYIFAKDKTPYAYDERDRLWDLIVCEHQKDN